MYNELMNNEEFNEILNLEAEVAEERRIHVHNINTACNRNKYINFNW
jgi:hypothetical protein